MRISKFDIYNPYSNKNVTEDYVNVIIKALDQLGIECRMVDKLVRQKDDQIGVLVITAVDVKRAKKLGYKFAILWTQGILPEESFARHSSKLRFEVISFIEKQGIRNANFVFLVSNEMKCHFEEKYSLEITKSYIMPCFNDEFEKKTFICHDYSKNIFAYVGSLSVWQCFDDSLRIYKEIEQKHPNTFLKVLTPQIEDAKKIIEKVGIKNFEVRFVPKEMVAKELSDVKFGFCIRDNIKVNNVATPTKLSSYVCNGVMPIFTKALRDFYNESKGCRFTFCYDDANFENKLDDILTREITSQEVFDEYTKYFSNYYSKAYHTEKIKEIFENLF